MNTAIHGLARILNFCSVTEIRDNFWCLARISGRKPLFKENFESQRSLRIILDHLVEEQPNINLFSRSGRIQKWSRYHTSAFGDLSLGNPPRNQVNAIPIDVWFKVSKRLPTLTEVRGEDSFPNTSDAAGCGVDLRLGLYKVSDCIFETSGCVSDGIPVSSFCLLPLTVAFPYW